MSTGKQCYSATGKAPPEKSNFAQTCSRLSLFLKEKGNLRQLHMGINGKFDDMGKAEKPLTFDLLSNMEDRGEKTTSLLPQHVSLDSFCKPEEWRNRDGWSRPVSQSESESKAAQMTIFYGGQVVVFDDVPAERARDVMLAAGSRPPSTPTETGVELASTSSDVCGSTETKVQANGLDLPIARRASLHKFLAKRKDRATGRAPYQLHDPAGGAGASTKEHKFDLNL